MAKKTRKQKQRTAARHQTGPAQPVAASAARPSGVVDRAGTAGAANVPAAGATALRAPAEEPFAPDAGRRRVARNMPAAQALPSAGRQQRAPLRNARFGSAAAMVEPLDSDDPAIPFDRVPYVPSDLRRVALIAATMIVLILIAWAIVSNVVD
jgi:hypothetical protein